MYPKCGMMRSPERAFSRLMLGILVNSEMGKVGI